MEQKSYEGWPLIALIPPFWKNFHVMHSCYILVPKYVSQMMLFIVPRCKFVKKLISILSSKRVTLLT